jgi:ribosomal protein L34E
MADSFGFLLAFCASFFRCHHACFAAPWHAGHRQDPSYFGVWDLPDGQDRVVTIDYVQLEDVTAAGGKKERKTVAHLKNGLRPLILNCTNMKTIQSLYKSPYVEDWRGCSIQIYYDPTIRFGRETTGGLRIRHEIPKQEKITLRCADCGSAVQDAYGKRAAQISAHTYKKYGKELCADCATKWKEKLDRQAAAAAVPDPFAGGAQEKC